MKSRNNAILSLATIALLTGGALAAGAQEAPVVPGEILVGIRPEFNTMRSAQSLSTWGRILSSQPVIGAHRLKLNRGVSMDAAIAALRSRADVAYAEPNHILRVCSGPNDPYYINQWAPPKIQADLAWSIWSPKTQVIVAVVDTGVDGKHPDLVDQMLRDASGIVGYDAFQSQRDPAADGFGHGTHCAGIIDAEANNSIGVVGIAGYPTPLPVNSTGILSLGVHAAGLTSNVKIMPVKVLDSSGSGSDSTVADGILWAANHGAKVISLSLGGAGASATMSNACTYAWNKGCVVVAAAGNDSVSSPFYPAACANVLSVAATDDTDSLASFSNWGSWVAVAAPGDTILSTLPTYQVQPGWPLNYAFMSGTSMAAPHVAAEAAMLLAQNPNLSNAQVVNIITSNVDAYHPTSGHTIGAGAGRINVYKALQAAGAGAPAAPAVPGAPTGLAASVGVGSVRLTWSAAAGATGYNVKRATRSGGPYVTVAGNIKGVNDTDNGLANGTVYYYVVSAVNAGGESANSAEVKAITPAPPAAPNGLTGKAVNGTVQLNWNLPASAGVVQINIYRSTQNGVGFVLIKTVGRVTSFTDMQPMLGANSYYAVKALNNFGQISAFSNQATVPATTH
ncbi:MAG TPA: S8 family serine peptidase [Chthonomonadaceae bacterium]|nr:S8 family serine peptidase [Chthonomonadaceae bacterium]